MNQHFIIPPPPPPGCDVIQIPVVGFTVEADHAKIRTDLMESIRSTGGFGRMRLKHVPEEVCHLPGQSKPPPQLLATAGLKPSGKILPAGRGALMDDLSVALQQRQMKKELKKGRGRGRPAGVSAAPKPPEVINPVETAESTSF